MTFSAMRNCGKCEKAIWGIRASGFKCAHCGQCFHPECRDSIQGQRQCLQRKKLDFSLKKLTYLQEVAVIPYSQSLHVAGSSGSSITNSMQASMNNVPIVNFSNNTTPNTSGVSLTASGNSSLSDKPTPTMPEKSPRVRSMHLRNESSSSLTASQPSSSSLAGTTPSMRLATGPKHIHRNKAVLCFFDDGLGIAHIRSDETGADKFDFMGDLPWAILDESSILDTNEQDDEWTFTVRARFQEWRFALPTKTEQEAMVSKLNEARRTGATRKRAQSTGSQMVSIVKKDDTPIVSKK
jgi:hypothetical protein